MPHGSDRAVARRTQGRGAAVHLLPRDHHRARGTPRALRADQKDGYALLMKAAAEAIVELARDPRYVGGTVGVLDCSIPGPSSSSTIPTCTAW